MFLIIWLMEAIAYYFFIILMALCIPMIIVFLLIVKKKIKQRKNIIILTMMFFLIPILYGINIWYTSPLSGYTDQFIQSNGGDYTHREVFMKKHEALSYNLSGTIGTGIGGHPTQQDVDLQIKIANELNKSREVTGFGIGSEQAINPNLDYSGLDSDIAVAINDLNPELTDKEGQMPNAKAYVRLFSGRENVTITNMAYGYLSFEGTKDIRELNMTGGYTITEIKRIDFEGIENVEQITFSVSGDKMTDLNKTYIYYPKYRLEEFLHDFGWLDSDGYYGKTYVKPKDENMYKEALEEGGEACDMEVNGDRGDPPTEFGDEGVYQYC